MKSLESAWLTRVAVLALMTSVVAACGDDSTGPSGTLEPTDAAAAMDQVVAQFVEGNQATLSLGVFSNLIIGALTPDIAPVASLLPSGEDPSVTGWADRVRLSAVTIAESGYLSRIPVGATGKTFVYNPSTGQYEIDETRTGAPSNGVRFVLYAVDPILQQPIEPLQEIGMLEIVDNSDFPTADIGLTVDVNSVTVLSAGVTGTFSQTSSNLDLSGFLSNGTERLDFGFDATFTETTASLDFEASFDNITVGFGFDGDAELSGGSFTTFFSNGDDTISFILTVSGGTIQDGSGVFLNASRIAIISGSMEQPTVTNGEGEPLTEAELQALGELFEGIGEVVALFTEIFLFGVILLSLVF